MGFTGDPLTFCSNAKMRLTSAAYCEISPKLLDRAVKKIGTDKLEFTTC